MSRELERPRLKDKPHDWDDGGCRRGNRCEGWSSLRQEGRWPSCKACGLCWCCAPERCANYSEKPNPSPGGSDAAGVAREAVTPAALSDAGVTA